MKMSGSNEIKKGKRTIQASPPDQWRDAPRPNYDTNTDLAFPYSEYPRKDPYEYYSVQLGTQDSAKILDFWGEGRIVAEGMTTGFRGAYNVNHQFQLVSNGPDRNRKIPNRIPTIDYDSVSVERYVPDRSFDIVTLMGAPITQATAAEISRIISGHSHCVVVTYGVPEDSSHIATLEKELDGKELVLSPRYALPRPLNEVSLTPALAFRPIADVVNQATSSFLTENMGACAEVLRSLKRSSRNQTAAGKALRNFFAQDAVKNSYLIFALGYELDKSDLGKQVMDSYMNGNVVKIVRSSYTSIKIRADNAATIAYLCVNGSVPSGSWQYAFFGASTYIDGDATYKNGDKFTVEPSAGNTKFRIRSTSGTTSYLCVNGSVPKDSWQWAFFGTASYLDSSTYRDGQYFYLIPISGGAQFKVQSCFGTESYLCTNGKVPAGSWQWAFFGTAQYLSPSYSGGELFTLIVN
jgi:expansin (peptidoglycan-binding protein)